MATSARGGYELVRVGVYNTSLRVGAGAPQPDGFPCEVAGGFFRDYGQNEIPLLWFEEKDPPPGLVAHECLHAAVWILQERCRVPLAVGTFNWEEAMCYLLQFLVQETTAALARVRKRGVKCRK